MVRFKLFNLTSLRFPVLDRQPGRVWIGWGLAVASTTSFSLATPLGKVILASGIDPAALLAVRYMAAALLMVITFGLTVPETLRIDWFGLRVVAAIGLFNGLGSLTFFWSLTRLDASVATMIFSLNPLVVLGVLALRGEPLTRRHFARLAFGVAGAYLLLGPGGRVDLVGTLLAFGSVMGFAIQLALIQWFLRDYDMRTVALYVLAGMAVVAAISWASRGTAWIALDTANWLGFGTLVLVSTFFGWWAMFVGINRIGSGQVALLMPLETLLAILWSFLFLGESMSLEQLAGGGLILSSALLAAQRLRRVRWRPRWRTWLRL